MDVHITLTFRGDLLTVSLIDQLMIEEVSKLFLNPQIAREDKCILEKKNFRQLQNTK